MEYIESYARDPVLTDKELIRHNLLVRIACLYYILGMTHQEIANQEGLSRIKVTRILKEAIDKKIIEFNIKDPIIHTLELEEEFRKTFGLKKAIITPTPQKPEEVYGVLGRFAADFLMRSLTDGMNIGLDWGRTLYGMIPYLAKANYRDIKNHNLTGGLAANPNQPNPYDVASSIANKIGGAPFYPIFPVIVENEDAKTVFLKEKHYKEIVELWGHIDIALVSVGVVTPETGLYYSQAYPQREVVKVKKAGAIGDILARPFDIDGNLIKTSFTDRIITIDFENLRHIPLVLGIAGGPKKVDAIYGALRSGYLNALVTDEESAKALLALQSKID